MEVTSCNFIYSLQDDAAHLDPHSVYDWGLIATQFIAEYLDLEIISDAGVSEKSNRGRLLSNL